MDNLLRKKMKVFNVSLITHRKINGYSQQCIADYLDISFRKYQRIEHGQAEINVFELYKLANLYKVSTQDILECTHQMYPTKEYNPNTLDKVFINFKKKLENEFLPKLVNSKSNSKTLDEKLLSDENFIKNDLPMYFTDFRNVIYNEKIIERMNTSHKLKSCISKINIEPRIFLDHLKNVIMLDSDFFSANLLVRNVANELFVCKVTGYINREIDNYFIFSYLNDVVEYNEVEDNESIFERRH